MIFEEQKETSALTEGSRIVTAVSPTSSICISPRKQGGRREWGLLTSNPVFRHTCSLHTPRQLYVCYYPLDAPCRASYFGYNAISWQHLDFRLLCVQHFQPPHVCLRFQPWCPAPLHLLFVVQRLPSFLATTVYYYPFRGL